MPGLLVRKVSGENALDSHIAGQSVILRAYWISNQRVNGDWGSSPCLFGSLKIFSAEDEILFDGWEAGHFFEVADLRLSYADFFIDYPPRCGCTVSVYKSSDGGSWLFEGEGFLPAGFFSVAAATGDAVVSLSRGGVDLHGEILASCGVRLGAGCAT